MLEQRIAELIEALNANTAAIAGTAVPVKETPAADAPVPTLADVREALLAHSKAHDRQSTLGVLARFVPEGAQLIVGNVDKTDYVALIAACEAA